MKQYKLYNTILHVWQTPESIKKLMDINIFMKDYKLIYNVENMLMK